VIGNSIYRSAAFLLTPARRQGGGTLRQVGFQSVELVMLRAFGKNRTERAMANDCGERAARRRGQEWPGADISYQPGRPRDARAPTGDAIACVCHITLRMSMRCMLNNELPNPFAEATEANRQ
jgi:hypothetical protein